ncbi:hypothetical protein [Pandoraea pulmonicola]|uniref:Uncharacterized protein n=1 Tax=Pandoraea pulmonicola TaxID=93221 RepID=A0AAJ4ZB23_PANPU|nr:hypothetical protein [Pandoraea pulmonicola]AJC21286.1 hypothetical protein RO07_13740 [Pandoraea pulmonicola]SUA90011.1 Uncharacterised protein [Pandoraea pulmonicola]
MNAPESIARHEDRPDPHGLDFDALRRAGISTLQALCGDRWTDYNLHDPGVTILEQLCYAITELGYRSDFPPEDYLVGDDGQIDYPRHALHPADEIFPSEVLTFDDYRKLLYDTIPELEDVWLTRDDRPGATGRPAHGLCRIAIKLNDALHDNADAQTRARHEAAVCLHVRQVFHAHRNLGEDLSDVVVVPVHPVYLSGEVQIHSERDPASIFADIFFQCARAVHSGFRVERYVKAFDAGVPLETLFAGPRTAHGYIASTGAQAQGAPVTIARLVGLVQAVDGVAHVQRLALCNADGSPVNGDSVTGASGAVLRLQFPGDAQSNFLRLHFASGAMGNGTRGHSSSTGNGGNDHRREEKSRVVLDDARVALAKARFEFDTLRNTRQSVTGIVPAPQGRQRVLRDYFSIQHQFPAIYGINRFGVLPTAPLANRVSAHQLKAYLYLAEQLMANYLENLQSVGRMFSVDKLYETYFSQTIDNDALPDIEAFYTDAPAAVRSRLEHIVSRKDRAEDRRSRLLDVLLAMYGETYSQKSLRRFDDYQDEHGARWLIDNKLDFLRHIATLSRDRACAFDITAPDFRPDGRANIAGVHAKISILLGLPAEPPRAPLSDALLRWHLRLQPDRAATKESYEHAAARLIVLKSQGELPAGGAHKGEARAAPGDMLPGGLLVHGVRLENYVLRQHGDAVHVHFRTHDARLGGDPAGEVQLARFQGDEAVAFADRYVEILREFLCELSQQSEGFYLVEHVLLRPRHASAADGSDEGTEGATAHDEASFFNARVSVVFPAWTARFSDPDFRLLAQETVCRNLPAHLLPEFHWLDYVAMRDFEHRYSLWRARLRERETATTAERLDAASASLRALLMRRRRAHNLTLWV